MCCSVKCSGALGLNTQFLEITFIQPAGGTIKGEELSLVQRHFLMSPFVLNSAGFCFSTLAWISVPGSLCPERLLSRGCDLRLNEASDCLRTCKCYVDVE